MVPKCYTEKPELSPLTRGRSPDVVPLFCMPAPLSTQTLWRHQQQVPVQGDARKKVSFWSVEFPKEYANVLALVDVFTTRYPVAKLAQLSYEDRGRLHRKLVKAVDEVLPDSWSNWESSAENSNAKSKTAADVFVANANFRLRLKKKQGACKKSVHSTPGGDRRDLLGEQAEQRSKMRAGTLVLSETMVMSVKMVCFLAKLYNMSSMIPLYCSSPFGWALEEAH